MWHASVLFRNIVARCGISYLLIASPKTPKTSLNSPYKNLIGQTMLCLAMFIRDVLVCHLDCGDILSQIAFETHVRYLHSGNNVSHLAHNRVEFFF